MGKRVLGNDGEPCPRCGRPSQIREHKVITKRLLQQPYYFSRWFYCLYHDCQTQTFMLEEYKVHNHLGPMNPESIKTIIWDDAKTAVVPSSVPQAQSEAHEKPPWED